MRAKLGLMTQEPEDICLAEDLLDMMHRFGADYTNTFRDLTLDSLPEGTMYQSRDFKEWYDRWQARLERQPDSREASRRVMKTFNPAVIPRNHRVEEALESAVEHNDFTVMERLLEVLSRPYRQPPEEAGYHLPAPASAKPYRTFCGT
jgi:uncharacterized protein YdiU (UPF0061 family)